MKKRFLEISTFPRWSNLAALIFYRFLSLFSFTSDICMALLQTFCCMNPTAWLLSTSTPFLQVLSLPINCRQMKRYLCVVLSINSWQGRQKPRFVLHCKERQCPRCSVLWCKSLSTMNCPAGVRRRKMVLLSPLRTCHLAPPQ